MKAVVATFNQEKALVGAFSVIVQLHRSIVYTALAKMALCKTLSQSAQCTITVSPVSQLALQEPDVLHCLYMNVLQSEARQHYSYVKKCD